jgi:hypothetical protein
VLLLLALVLTVTLLPATAADAAVQRVKPRFFGMTDSDPSSWPNRPVGAMRLWDAGVAWHQIEVAPNQFDWTRLDAVVQEARSNGAKPLLVLGMTPQFHAKKPHAFGLWGEGTSSPPKMWAWKRYVRKVVNRYGSKLDYQVYNEANVVEFWAGTPRQMAKLTKVTYNIVNRIAPRAKVVSPALATRLTGQRKWLRTFYAQRLKRKPVSRFMDIVAVHLYPLPNQGPEESMDIFRSVRTMLGWADVHKPIWNTEINYGLQVGGGGTAKNISRRKEAAYVARTYILNASMNIKRVYWYSWALQDLANTQLTRADGSTVTRAGIAYGVVREWLLRTKMQGCDENRRGTFTCTVTYGKGVKRIYWNPDRRATIRAVGSATRMENLRGTQEKLTGGERIRVGKMPVMIRSKR